MLQGVKIALEPGFRAELLKAGIDQAKIDGYEARVSERILIGLAPSSKEAALRAEELDRILTEFEADLEERWSLSRTAEDRSHSLKNFQDALALGMTPDEFDQMRILSLLIFRIDGASMPAEAQAHVGALFERLDARAGQILGPRLKDGRPSLG